MSLDAAAITKIEQLTRDAEPIVRAPDFAATGRYFIRQPGVDGGSELVEQTAEIVPDSAQLYDTNSLARLIKRSLEDHAEHAVVFYGPERIGAVLTDVDGITRRHRLDLDLHPAFVRLQRLIRTEAFTQKTLIRLLRAEFNGHVDDRVIERFRTLNLKTDGSGQSVVAQGRAGVDKRIQQAISDQGGKEIPTEIEVTVPVYGLDEARDDVRPVGVLVDVSPDEDGRPEFELTTVINTLSTARHDALESIVASLRGALPTDGSVPIYYGSV